MELVTNNAAALLIAFTLCISFLPSLNAADDGGNSTFISEVCEEASYKDLCISSLEAEHASQDASKDADLAAIALISVRVASNNGSDTSVYIKKILDGTKLEPAVDQNYEDCEEHYISAMQQLDGALSSVVSRDYKSAKTWLEAAITDATACENGLKQSPGNELELVEKNTIFRQLCSNALDIVTILITD